MSNDDSEIDSEIVKLNYYTQSNVSEIITTLESTVINILKGCIFTDCYIIVDGDIEDHFIEVKHFASAFLDLLKAEGKNYFEIPFG
ncbi:23829_t:CDS:1, partial [Racocetra persica]